MTKSETDRYPVEVFWSDEDKGYIAVAPDLPGSSAWGATEADALREIRIAIEGWIAASQAAGNPVPPPSDRTAPPQFSGKFLVRVPRTLHAQLVQRAAQEGVSLNVWATHLLSQEPTAKGRAALAPLPSVVPLRPSDEQYISHLMVAGMRQEWSLMKGALALNYQPLPPDFRPHQIEVVDDRWDQSAIDRMVPQLVVQRSLSRG